MNNYTPKVLEEKSMINEMTNEDYSRYWNSKEGLTRTFNAQKNGIDSYISKGDFDSAKLYLAECEETWNKLQKRIVDPKQLN